MVDRERLKGKIAEAKAIAKDGYTEESYGNLQSAIAAAEGVYGNENASQEQIDEQVELLKIAISALEKKPEEKPEDPKDPEKPSDPKDPEKPGEPDDPHKPGTTPTTPTTPDTPGDTDKDKPNIPVKPSGNGLGNKTITPNGGTTGTKGTSGSGVKAAKTKDEAQAGLFLCSLAVSAVGILLLEVKRKKNRR